MISFLLVGSVLLLAAISPGPDFVVVSKNALLHSRRSGIYTAIGVGLAVLIHATYTIAGLGIVISQSILLFGLIKWAGALYLAYLGLALLFGKGVAALDIAERKEQRTLSPLRSLSEGFATNLFNPKATLFFIGVFSQVIDPAGSLPTRTVYVAESGLIVGGWFVLLSVILTVPVLKRTLARIMRPLERLMGVVLLSFAVKLAAQRA